jgi:hypothetical protein
MQELRIRRIRSMLATLRYSSTDMKAETVARSVQPIHGRAISYFTSTTPFPLLLLSFSLFYTVPDVRASFQVCRMQNGEARTA